MCTEGDYCVFKLDIDTPTVEVRVYMLATTLLRLSCGHVWVAADYPTAFERRRGDPLSRRDVLRVPRC
jgi:hypothetical protein